LTKDFWFSVRTVLDAVDKELGLKLAEEKIPTQLSSIESEST